MASSDITGLHHVGLLVHDMTAAIDVFRRLGFHIGPPSYPALPPAPGATPEPIGAGNTHADFPRSFIELLALAPDQREHLPADAELVPLQIPDDRLEATRAVMRQTIAGLAARLERSEGAHILVYSSSDAEQTATRLSEAGIDHSGAQRAQRPITTAEGTRLEAIKYLEINDSTTEPSSMPPEGRIGVAEDAPPEILDAQTGLDHPNGAVGLVECVLSVSDGELESTADRYERYLGILPERDGLTRVFVLDSGRLTITTRSALTARLPGERPRTSPALSAYVIEVNELAAAERLLRDRDIELRQTDSGEPFVPASAAHGAAIILRQAVNTGMR